MTIEVPSKPMILLCDVLLDLFSDSSSDLAAKLNQELETTEHLDASVLAYLQYCGMFPDRMDSVKEKEILSPQLKVKLIKIDKAFRR